MLFLLCPLHTKFEAQTLFLAKGIYSNWDCLGNIAAGINHLQLVKEQVSRLLRSSYQGSTHMDVDTLALLWQIANKAKGLELQSLVPGCDHDSAAKPVTDIYTTGFRKFQSSSLATFNKKLEDMQESSPTQPKVDEIAPCQVMECADIDDLESPSGDQSVLHEE